MFFMVIKFDGMSSTAKITFFSPRGCITADLHKMVYLRQPRGKNLLCKSLPRNLFKAELLHLLHNRRKTGKLLEVGEPFHIVYFDLGAKALGFGKIDFFQLRIAVFPGEEFLQLAVGKL